VDVLQCPACMLKFRFAGELEDHLKLEHPDFHVEEDPTRGSPLDEARRRREKARRND
jgi:hypothetical protein